MPLLRRIAALLPSITTHHVQEANCGIALAALLVSLWFFGCTDLGEPTSENFLNPEESQPSDTQAAWSPDGNWIAYLHEDFNNMDSTYPMGLYVINSQGQNRRLLVRGSVRYPAWSPNGNWIAYHSGAVIYVVSFQGDSIRSIVGGFFPSWSPDGTKIVYDTPYQDPRGASVIWIVDADGTNARDISQHGIGAWRDPDWSPDGRKILHLRGQTGVMGEEVFVMDTSGNNPVRLSYDDFEDRTPEWSPDGTRIAWTKLIPAPECWIMSSNGSNKRLLAKNVLSATWSSNSERLVLSKPNTAGTKILLWTINVDGSNLKQLTY